MLEVSYRTWDVSSILLPLPMNFLQYALLRIILQLYMQMHLKIFLFQTYLPPNKNDL